MPRRSRVLILRLVMVTGDGESRIYLYAHDASDVSGRPMADSRFASPPGPGSPWPPTGFFPWHCRAITQRALDANDHANNWHNDRDIRQDIFDQALTCCPLQQGGLLQGLDGLIYVLNDHTGNGIIHVRDGTAYISYGVHYQFTLDEARFMFTGFQLLGGQHDHRVAGYKVTISATIDPITHAAKYISLRTEAGLDTFVNPPEAGALFGVRWRPLETEVQPRRPASSRTMRVL